MISHQIKNTSSSNSDQDLFDIVTLDFKYLIGYVFLNILIYFYILIQVNHILKKKFKFLNLIECLRITSKLIMKSIDNGFQNSKFFKIKFFSFIVFTIYILTYFTEIFISNSLKTSKIVIDTDKIIHNEQLLFSSEKFICWIRSDPSFALAESSPKDTLLEKILRFKNKKNCFFEQDTISYDTIQIFKEGKSFILAAYFFSIVLISSLINFEKTSYWISESFYELTLSYPYRKTLELDKKLLLNKM